MSFHISDIMGVVAGVAVALSLPQLLGEEWIMAAGVREPWTTWLRVAELTARLTIVAAPLVVTRRLRLGGAFRPAEWLILVNATHSMHERLMIQGMKWASEFFGWRDANDRLRAWYRLGLIGLVLVIPLLVVWGRTLPRWFRLSLLALLPLFAFWGFAKYVSYALDRLWEVLIWPPVETRSLVRQFYLRLMESPEHIFVCVALVATVRDLIVRGGRGWSWLEWAGLAGAIVMAIGGGLVIQSAIMHNFSSLDEQLGRLSVDANCWVLYLVVAWIFVQAFGAPWGRWMAYLEGGEGLARGPADCQRSD